MGDESLVHCVILGVEGQVHGVFAYADRDPAIETLGRHLVEHGAVPSGPEPPNVFAVAESYLESLRTMGSASRFSPSGVHALRVQTAAAQPSVAPQPHQASPPPPHQTGLPPNQVGPHRSLNSNGGNGASRLPHIREDPLFSGHAGGPPGQLQAQPRAQPTPSAGEPPYGSAPHGPAAHGLGPGSAVPAGPCPTPQQLASPGTIAVGKDEQHGWGLAVSGKHLGYYPTAEQAIAAVQERVPEREWSAFPVYVVDGQRGEIRQIDLTREKQLANPVHAWPLSRTRNG